VIAPKVARLPKKIDLQAKCSPVEDQGQLGSCTANSLVGALGFLEKEDRATFVDLSRLFIYYNECVIEGTVNDDSGAFLRDGIKSLAKQGACPEQSWPYAVSDFKKKPSASCYATARKHRIKSYHRINLCSDLKN
jgi:C1A family cysteine protease